MIDLWTNIKNKSAKLISCVNHLLNTTECFVFFIFCITHLKISSSTYAGISPQFRQIDIIEIIRRLFANES